MPPPRASRLATRKSVVPDPSLYDNLSDSDDDAPKRQPRAAGRANTSTTQQNTSANGASTSKRRTRASLDSADDRPPAKQPKAASSSRAKADTSAAKGKKSAASGTGSRTRGRGGEDEEDESGVEEGDSRASKASSSRATKKAKTGSNGVNGTSGAASTSRAIVVDDDEEEDEPVRRGFVPRAAARAGFKPKAGPSSSQARGAPDEGELPPRNKDPAPSARGRAAKDTSRSKSSRDYSPTGDQSRPVYAPAIDTPKNHRNKSYREGIPATPGTAAPRSARRTSTDNRGKRASGIGTGFEAGPHKRVPDDRLFRHAGGAEVPLAHRMRSVASWASQRQRDKAFPAGAGRGDPGAAVVEAFIGRVCASQVTVSTRAQASRQGDRSLARHPQNVANEARQKEIQGAFEAIAAEQAQRHEVAERYEGLQARREARRPEAVAAMGEVEGELSLAGLSLSEGPRTMEEALRLGRDLLAGKGGAAADRKGKGRETEAEVDPALAAVRLKIAAFRQITHRLSAFQHVGEAFVAARSAQTHAALEAGALRGLPSTTAATGLTAGDAAQDGARRALATAAGGAGPERVVAGLDPRDLLRAISATDQRSRGLA